MDSIYKNANSRLSQASDAYNSKIQNFSTFVKFAQDIKIDNKKITAQEIADNIEKTKEIIEKAFDKKTTKADSHEKLDKLTIDDNKNNNYNRSKKELIEKAEDLAQIIKDYLNDIEEKNKNIIIKNCISVSDADFISSKLTIPQYKNDIYEDLIKISGIIQKEVDEFELCKQKKIDKAWENTAFKPEEKRKILYNVLQELKKKEFILIQNDEGFLNAMSHLTEASGRNTVKVDDPNSVCKDGKSWGDFLNCIKLYDANEDNKKKNGLKQAENIALNTLIHAFNSETLTNGWKENHIFHPQVEGEILLSDTAGNTCNIKGDVIHKTACSPLKEALAVLKKI